MRAALFTSALGAAAALGACAVVPLHVAALDDMERVRVATGAQEGAKLSPETFARGEQERGLAEDAHSAGDDVGAVLHAQHAIAAYHHALSVARLARATTELADAQKSLGDATTQEEALDASRSKLDSEAEELEQRVRVARERLLPASSARATPELEAARLVAARSLGMQAHLLCSAARLISPKGDGLADADAALLVLEQRLAKDSRPAPIDDAARARAGCLDVLTRARRGAPQDTGDADALLAELSAAGGWDPTRDERGVIVTLRDSFHGPELTAAAATRLKNLGGVAAAHPTYAVQVVVHDARAPAPNDATDAKRADAAVQALAGGGATAARVRAELAGARVPIVDPSDRTSRPRNERLEVVFVGNAR
jgi:outer membrane protein OmpA-like peptidoglycan-associated protein